jgi:hypothetical protein
MRYHADLTQPRDSTLRLDLLWPHTDQGVHMACLFRAVPTRSGIAHDTCHATELIGGCGYGTGRSVDLLMCPNATTEATELNFCSGEEMRMLL